MDQGINVNPHLAAERWDFARLVANSTSHNPEIVEAVLDQFRIRVASWDETQLQTASEIAQRIQAEPLNVTVGAAASDLLSALALYKAEE